MHVLVLTGSCRYPHLRYIYTYRKSIHVDHNVCVSVSPLGSDLDGSSVQSYSSFQSAKQCHNTELESHSYIRIQWSLCS